MIRDANKQRKENTFGEEFWEKNEGTDTQYERGGRMRGVRQRSEDIRSISNSSFTENCGQRSGVSHRRDTADWRRWKTTAGEGHKA